MNIMAIICISNNTMYILMIVFVTLPVNMCATRMMMWGEAMSDVQQFDRVWCCSWGSSNLQVEGAAHLKTKDYEHLPRDTQVQSICNEEHTHSIYSVFMKPEGKFNFLFWMVSKQTDSVCTCSNTWWWNLLRIGNTMSSHTHLGTRGEPA